MEVRRGLGMHTEHVEDAVQQRGGLSRARSRQNAHLRIIDQLAQVRSLPIGPCRENIPARPASDWSVVRRYPGLFSRYSETCLRIIALGDWRTSIDF
eukprot:114054-Prorocentrum_minimum.AAC.1